MKVVLEPEAISIQAFYSLKARQACIQILREKDGQIWV